MYFLKPGSSDFNVEENGLLMYVMELKDLLTELRVYLGETLTREKLSPSAEEHRQRLLSRLLPITPTSSMCSSAGGYMDMTRAATLPSLNNLGKKDSCSTYQAMSDPGTSTNSASVKSGRLGRRERFLWMGQTRKWWAVLSSSAVLSLFSGQFETRPLTVIPLENYQARPASQNKPNTIIELFSPGNKTYQFIASDKDEMDSWIETINEICSKRRLPRAPSPVPLSTPTPPHELYDTPDARVRPVTPSSKQEYEAMDGSFYQVIPDNKVREQLYKNIGNINDDVCYYNLPLGATEEIYQTIMETDKGAGGMGQNRIQAIIKAMEASIAEAQLYEPVDGNQESAR